MRWPILVPTLLLAACRFGGSGPLEEPRPAGLELVATSQRQWTGVAATASGALYVCFPRWSDDVPVSVARLRGDGSLQPFPDLRMQQWAPGKDPERHLVCVQALHVDGKGRLWILDPANPRFEGVVPGGPKLLAVDPDTGRILDRSMRFGAEIAPAESYLNDLRVDAEKEIAYVTDSGRGGLVVCDLRSGVARRVLDRHPSTLSEGLALSFDGRTWRRPDGSLPQVHADGIALSPDRGHLYWQALTGGTLYRIPTNALNDPELPPAELAARVEEVAATGPADGIHFGPDGKLWITALQEGALKTWDSENGVAVFLRDPRLVWPDSLAPAPDKGLFVTTARIHEGAEPRGRYGLYRVWLPR